jgi:nucleoside-diphosphate-sugar epimerase
MRVFVAGATGVLERTLVLHLVARPEVVGMTRRASKQDQVRSLGAHPGFGVLKLGVIPTPIVRRAPDARRHRATAYVVFTGESDRRR